MKLDLNIGSFRLAIGQSQQDAKPAEKSTMSPTVLHEGAVTNSPSRTRLFWTPQDYIKEMPRFSRLIQLGKARKFYASDGLTRGAIGTFARHTVGTGIMAQAQTDSEEANDAYERYWKNWCKIADWNGRLSFNRMQQIICKAVDRDGDIFILMLKTPSGFPKVQLIESHRIGNLASDDMTAAKDGSRWVDGVRLSADGTPLAYRLKTTAPDGRESHRDIEASSVIHVVDPDRVNEVRGVTSLYHALNTLHDRYDILAFEKKGVKRDSQTRAVLKTQNGSAIEGEDWDTEEIDADGNKVVLAKTKDGETEIISTDEELTPWQSDRPSPTFVGFLDHLIRDVCIGLGLPFEFIWSPEKLGGTAQRFILEQAQRRIEERQQLLIETVLNRLWFWVIASGIKRGDIPSSENYWDVKWQCPSKITVDAGREAQQEREDLKMGLTTEAESFSKRGKDWREERNQREREIRDLLTRAKAIAKEYDIPVQSAVQLLQMSTPNGNLFSQDANADQGNTQDQQKKDPNK